MSRRSKSSGLTLVELVVTLSIVALSFVLVGSRLGISNFWKEEAFLRKIRETITFLYQQAIVDQVYYRMQFDFETQQYRVLALKVEDQNQNPLTQQAGGYLTDELAAILSPALGSSFTMIPPPSFPSLAEPVKLPGDLTITSVKTTRGTFDAREAPAAYILFSPRGFSEFAVIHLNQGPEGRVTILINPFVGSTELYRDDRDFDWNYGRNSKDKNAN